MAARDLERGASPRAFWPPSLAPGGCKDTTLTRPFGRPSPDRCLPQSEQLPNNASLDMTSAYTLEAWLYVDDVAPYRPILVRGADDGTDANDIEG